MGVGALISLISAQTTTLAWYLSRDIFVRSLLANSISLYIADRICNMHVSLIKFKEGWASEKSLKEFCETFISVLLWFYISFQAKKVYLNEFICLLEVVQYLSKIPQIGWFSTISSFQIIHLKLDKISWYFKSFTLMSFDILYSIKKGINNKNQNHTSNYKSKIQNTYHPIFPVAFFTILKRIMYTSRKSFWQNVL